MRISFNDNFKIALRNIFAHRMRSFLTILGVIIGTGSVVFLISIGDGVEKFILAQVAGGSGTNVAYIEPGKQEGLSSEALYGINLTALKIKDVDVLRNLPVINYVAPVIYNNAAAQYKNRDRKVDFMGTTPDYAIIDNNAIPDEGGFITKEHVRSQSKVVVLGQRVTEDLFLNENPIGKNIELNGINFRVIGVMPELGALGFLDLNQMVFLPYTTVLKTLLNIDHITYMVAQFDEDVSSETAKEEIVRALRASHRIQPGEDNDFTVTTEEEARDILAAVTGALTLFLTSIAAIALVVGGIGIMNIMLVSVRERTKEIGLRKAVGARNQDILYQFLSESIVFTVLGGILGALGGLALALATSLIAQNYFDFDWPFVIPPMGILIAFSVSVLVGLIFGIYPAKKAAGFSPIEALRYE
jgi:putative ABC transport system permease protein